MNPLDYVVLAVLAVSALIGLLRGLIREALSLLCWVGAAWAAARFGAEGARVVAGFVDDPLLRLWSGRLLVFVGVLFAGTLLAWLVAYLARQLPITAVDRALGVCFGLVRGVLLVALLVVGLRLGGFDAEPWWRQSKLIPYAAAVTAVLEKAARTQLAASATPGWHAAWSTGRPACGGSPSCAA